MIDKNTSLHKFFSFYPAMFRILILIISMLTICAGVSALIVYPLWFTATHSTTAYNCGILFLTVALSGTLIVVHFFKTRKSGLSAGEIIKKAYLPLLGKIFLWLLMIMISIMAVMFFIHGSTAGGIVSCLVILLFAGIYHIFF